MIDKAKTGQNYGFVSQKRNRYYYWNTETDQVSWLSPSCPKAKFEYSKSNKIQV
jgi:hypothetical protein